MRLLVSLAAACVFVGLFAKPIKKVPWVFYILAVAFDIVYAYGIVYSLPPLVWQFLSLTIQRGVLATAFLIIVMYCGVFSERSKVRMTLAPIRAELSIIACILAFGHCLNYLNSYIGVLGSNIAIIGANQLASLIIAIVLFALLVVLTVTSFKVVRHAMSPTLWKNIQRSAYVFFGLIYVHEVLILYPSVVKGAGNALSMIVVSSIVFIGYYVLRVRRYLIDAKSGE